ncbi:MAG: trigger factor [Gammaproteobacteria bacterium]
MQVSVENTGELERRMTIEVPAERVDQEVSNRLQNMVRTARIDGFRPGKVPVKVVERKYGDQVRKEVVDQVVRTTLDEAMAQQQIELAGEPKIEWPDNSVVGQALEYVVTFQVYPELSAVQLGDAVLERPTIEINEQDVAMVMEKLRKQRAVWEPVEREARIGDKLRISYDGAINGESFPGSHGANVDIELGAETIVNGFDEQLVGATAGSERTVTVTYPEDLSRAEIAGKQASFKVKIISVAESRLPELGDDLALSFGVDEGGLEKFKEEVRVNMDRELDQALKLVIKERVFDILLHYNQVEVPMGLVEEEQKKIEALVSEGAGVTGTSMSVNEKSRRRVALGMLVGKIVKDNNLQVDAARVRQVVESLAASYENPNEVVSWYYDNSDRLGGVQAAVLEDQVVDWIVERLQVDDKSMTFDDLMQLRQEMNT